MVVCDPELRGIRVMNKWMTFLHERPPAYETLPRSFRDYRHRMWKLLNFSAYY